MPQFDMRSIVLAPSAVTHAVSALREGLRGEGVDADRGSAVEAVPNDASYPDKWALPKIGWQPAYGVVDQAGSAVVAVLAAGADVNHHDLDDGIVTGSSWVVGADGDGLDSDIIQGDVWATDHAADVVIMAFSRPGFSAALQAAIDHAWAHDVIVVTATGNDGVSSATFPAGDRGINGVSATEQSDTLAPFSNDDDVFLAAPGVGFITTTPGGGTISIGGRSCRSSQTNPPRSAMRPRPRHGRLNLDRDIAWTDLKISTPTGVCGLNANSSVIGVPDAAGLPTNITN